MFFFLSHDNVYLVEFNESLLYYTKFQVVGPFYL